MLAVQAATRSAGRTTAAGHMGRGAPPLPAEKLTARQGKGDPNGGRSILGCIEAGACKHLLVKKIILQHLGTASNRMLLHNFATHMRKHSDLREMSATFANL